MFLRRRKNEASTSPAEELSPALLRLPVSEALARIEQSDRPDWLRRAAQEVVRDGFTILRGVHSKEVCARAVREYEEWAASHRRYVERNLDELGREKRLVNFHLASDAAMTIGLQPRVLELLDFLFQSPAGVYTSLTFKYGTQQPVHRDTPHFATWPAKSFCGVWSPLEDVHPDAGPLFYYRGAHVPPLDPSRFWKEARRRYPRAGRREQLDHALDLYNGEVIRRAPHWGEHVVPRLSVGDVAIWHPETPHGGAPARDPRRTRWSIVFHCAPRSVQVHQHDRFFTHPGPGAPPDRYGFLEIRGRAVAKAGDVAFM